MSILPKEAFKQPLNRGFYGTLLKLEEKVNLKVITGEEVGSLTEMYGQIVSYYDTLGDPIKFYFIEKIQVAISEFTQIVMKEKEKSKQPKNIKPPRSLSASSKDKDSDDGANSELKDIVNHLPDDEAIPSLTNTEDQNPTQNKTRTSSITVLKKTRQKKMSMMIELEKAQEEQPEHYDKLLGTFEQDVSKNDQNIKKQLKNQTETLQNRLENRRQNRKQGSASLGQAPQGVHIFKTPGTETSGGGDQTGSAQQADEIDTPKDVTEFQDQE